MRVPSVITKRLESLVEWVGGRQSSRIQGYSLHVISRVTTWPGAKLPDSPQETRRLFTSMERKRAYSKLAPKEMDGEAFSASNLHLPLFKSPRVFRTRQSRRNTWDKCQGNCPVSTHSPVWYSSLPCGYPSLLGPVSACSFPMGAVHLCWGKQWFTVSMRKPISTRKPNLKSPSTLSFTTIRIWGLWSQPLVFKE